ncbi:tripartite tricarboxylate transporter TctB family protein [uncultured Xylophilus sp.]|uniref:tripartite tricarboxylate transporter TctB family protein n=1 Tax=uncultured Xylophilus sp. TaxID=296832 RepID=UPI0025D0A70F|nr:tripartite tricarboxylate transporter TctB family protein [uncultured Xylophilus sp.]
MTTAATPPAPDAAPSGPTPRWPQTLVGVGVLLVGLALAWGATGISSEAGYGGVGPNFFPWMSAVGLIVCGAWILWEVASGGFRQMGEPSGAAHADVPAFVWVSAGLLLNASVITYIGFILSCTLCYVLAVQGLRRSTGQAAGAPRIWAIDLVTGLLISAPVFWMFTQFLAINLPGLTATGWL